MKTVIDKVIYERGKHHWSLTVELVPGRNDRKGLFKCVELFETRSGAQQLADQIRANTYPTNGDKKSMQCSVDVAEYCSHLKVEKQEQFICLSLNTRNHVVKETLVAKGSVHECRVNPVDVFRDAIIEGSIRVILVHNHPSGDNTPSNDDRALTQRLKKAGEILGISILDHIVIGDGFSSFRDLGLLS